jgi:hypothetical protein
MTNIKTLISIILMICLAHSSSLFCQDNFNQTGSLLYDNNFITENESETDWPILSIGINPAGFLMFGPSVHADVKLFGRTCLSVFYINHSMGMLSEAMVFGDNPRIYGKNCMGFGAGLRQYFKPNEKMNAWYVGIFSGYSYNEATYHEGPPQECTEKEKDVVFAANFGHRWNLSQRFFLASGIIGGISYSNQDRLYSNYVYDYETMNYIQKERLIEDYSGEIYPYLFVEVTLGVKL